MCELCSTTCLTYSIVVDLDVIIGLMMFLSNCKYFIICISRIWLCCYILKMYFECYLLKISLINFIFLYKFITHLGLAHVFQCFYNLQVVVKFQVPTKSLNATRFVSHLLHCMYMSLERLFRIIRSLTDTYI